MIAQIEAYVQQVMANVSQPELRIAHDYKHVDRVRGWALQIAHAEGGVDLGVVEATALLHDIGLAFVEHRRDHARVGAEHAQAFLTDNELFAAHEITLIAAAIAAHSSLSGGGWLGELLRDADMLDMFGAIGIMRACTSHATRSEYDPANIKGETWGASAAQFTQRFQAGLGTGTTLVDQLNFQLSCADNLHTQTAKMLAAPLIQYMREYVLQLEVEVRANY